MTGAAAGQGAPAGDGGQQQGGEADGGPDVAALHETLTQQGQTLGELREFLQSEPWQQIQQAQPGEPEAQDDGLPDYDLGFLDPEVAATMDPQQLEQRLGETIQQQARSIAQQEIQQQMGPLREQIAEQSRNAEIQALIGEFPEMAEEATAQQVLGAAGQLAEQIAPGLAQALGADPREITEALAASPGFWRTTYMAGRAADAAHEESGDIPAPATLESGAGATPGGGQAGDLGDQIIGAREGRGVLPF